MISLMVFLPDIIGTYYMLGIAVIGYILLETSFRKKIPFGHEDIRDWGKKKFLAWFFITGFLLILYLALIVWVWPVILFRNREEVMDALGR